MRVAAPVARAAAGRGGLRRTHRSAGAPRARRSQRRAAPLARPVSRPVVAPARRHAARATAGGVEWPVWSALMLCGASGLWSERTAAGKALSGPLVSTLLALALSNVGALPAGAAAYGVVNAALLPLAIPLLLLSADLRAVLGATRSLLVAFACGSVGTVAGTLVAYAAVPLRALGEDAWRVAAALAARHVGGAVNYVAVAEALEVSPSVVASGLAADNLLCALYFSTLFWLARDLPPDADGEGEGGKDKVKRGAEQGDGDGDGDAVGESGVKRADINVVHGATSLALSAVLCWGGVALSRAAGAPQFALVAITALAVALATAFPRQLAPLVPSAEGLSTIIMQVFFAAIGAAAGSVAAVLTSAPALFAFCFVQMAVHLLLALGLGKLLGLRKRDVLLASNANVGGPTTAAGFAAAKGWRSSLVPGILVGVLGYATATFGAIALGRGVLAFM